MRRRPHLWGEVALIAVCYGLYSLARDLLPDHTARAFANARSVMLLESRLGIDIERPVNHWLAAHHVLAVGADYYYATLHFAAVIGLLVWLYWRRPEQYRWARSVLAVTTLAALAGFCLYPLAPPRLTPGFIDTIVDFHTWGSWGTGGLDTVSNQFAAMPSLHIAWSSWAALVVIKATRSRLRWLVLAYPALTFAVIISTGNHYVVDALAGLACLGFAVLAVRAASALHRPRTPIAPPRVRSRVGI
jgi:hypothetical protein